jgi:hypothetical protein
MEDDLRMFSELAKQQHERGDERQGEGDDRSEAAPESEEMANLATVIDWHLERAARRQETSVETQEKIFDIQKEKQAVMRRLKESLACLDNPDCVPEPTAGADRASYDSESGRFVLSPSDGRGRAAEATFGEVVTDLEWGIGHDLDKASVPRLMAKKYLIERAKHDLRRLLDRQITRSETGSSAVHESKKGAYERLEAETESGEVEFKTGSMAEKMVKCILKKAVIDDGRLPFEVLDADVYQDVEEKIDFIIRRRDRDRGVNVETSREAKDIAIQFTVNPNAARRKMEQIRRVKGKLLTQGDLDDLVLVVMPLPFVQRLRHEWQDGGRPSGGPDKLMDRDEARTVFRGVLKDVLGEKELDDAWAKIAPRFGKRART